MILLLLLIIMLLRVAAFVTDLNFTSSRLNVLDWLFIEANWFIESSDIHLSIVTDDLFTNWNFVLVKARYRLSTALIEAAQRLQDRGLILELLVCSWDSLLNQKCISFKIYAMLWIASFMGLLRYFFRYEFELFVTFNIHATLITARLFDRAIIALLIYHNGECWAKILIFLSKI